MDRYQVPNSSAESKIKEDRSLALCGCSPVSPTTLRCAEVRWGNVEVEHALFPRELTAICQGLKPGKEHTYLHGYEVLRLLLSAVYFCV